MIKKINNIPVSGYFFDSLLMISKDLLLIITGDNTMENWKNNLKIISQKENAHNSDIFTLSKLGNILVLSGSKDYSIKIWLSI